MRIIPTTLAALASLSAAGAAQAHFQLLYTPQMQLPEPADIELRMVFGHPLDNGHVMDMAAPERFFVRFRGEQTDLADSLTPITWQGAENAGKALGASFKAQRQGDYSFVLVPAPYWEDGENTFIQQFSKTIINRGGLPTDWYEPVGLPTEIVPMVKPYQVFAGSTFTGQLLSDGEPAAGIECEVEFINTSVDVTANAFGKETLITAPETVIVTMTDANGVFTFGIPRPGIWGFACLEAGPVTEHEGKELSQDAVLWINVVELD
ncbi:MAG: DUF4198 domain-containing protein [Chromatiaceae bacterium]|nr:MAG: DUF4198 domain-containing protein [Chromatiaceae bacterium]